MQFPQAKVLMKTATAIICSGFVVCAVAYTAPLEMRGGDDSLDDHRSTNEPEYTQQYVGANSAADTDTDPASDSATKKQLSFISRLSQLEGEVRDLRGQLEEQSHKMRQMISLQSKLFQDIDTRLDALAGMPNNGTHSPGIPQPRNAESKPSVQSPQNEQNAYQAAYNLLRNKQYAQAKHAMKSFIDLYPEGEFAVNAHYWLGELSLLTGDNKLAKSEFETVIKKYPASSKVSDAMLKVGLLYLEGGEQKQAKKQFQTIVTAFPNSASANIAKKRLQTL